MHNFSLFRCLALLVACLACLAYAAPRRPEVLKHTDKYGRWNVDLYTQTEPNGTVIQVVNAQWRRYLSRAQKSKWDTEVGCKYIYPNPNDRSVRVGHCSDEAFQYSINDRGFAVVQTVEHTKKGNQRVGGYWTPLNPKPFHGRITAFNLHGADRTTDFTRAARISTKGWARKVRSPDHERAFHELTLAFDSGSAIGNSDIE